MYRLLVTGSREWTDARRLGVTLRLAVRQAYGSGPAEGVTIVHGASRGADRMADRIARRMGWRVEAHPAEWHTHRPSCPEEHHQYPTAFCFEAGPIRNQKMVDLGADLCLAYIRDRSLGATHGANAAEQAGITTLRFRH